MCEPSVRAACGHHLLRGAKDSRVGPLLGVLGTVLDRRIPAAHKTKETRLASRRRISPSGGELRRRGYREAFGDWGVIMQLRYSGRGGRSNVEAPSRKPPSALGRGLTASLPMASVARVCGCLQVGSVHRAPLLVLLLAESHDRPRSCGVCAPCRSPRDKGDLGLEQTWPLLFADCL